MTVNSDPWQCKGRTPVIADLVTVLDNNVVSERSHDGQ